jgi:hypothetical protein
LYILICTFLDWKQTGSITATLQRKVFYLGVSQKATVILQSDLLDYCHLR